MNIDSSRLSEIVRRHVHDVRNHSNNLHLEVSLLSGLVTDPDAIECLRRMGLQFAQLESSLRGLTAMLVESPRVVLPAMELFEMWKSQIAPLENPMHEIEWHAPQGSITALIDPVAIVWVLRELTINAWKQLPAVSLKASVETTNEAIVVELRQPSGGALKATDVELERVVERNGGMFSRTIEPVTGEWLTRLSFDATLP